MSNLTQIICFWFEIKLKLFYFLHPFYNLLKFTGRGAGQCVYRWTWHIWMMWFNVHRFFLTIKYSNCFKYESSPQALKLQKQICVTVKKGFNHDWNSLYSVFCKKLDKVGYWAQIQSEVKHPIRINAEPVMVSQIQKELSKPVPILSTP